MKKQAQFLLFAIFLGMSLTAITTEQDNQKTGESIKNTKSYNISEGNENASLLNYLQNREQVSTEKKKLLTSDNLSPVLNYFDRNSGFFVVNNTTNTEPDQNKIGAPPAMGNTPAKARKDEHRLDLSQKTANINGDNPKETLQVSVAAVATKEPEQKTQKIKVSKKKVEKKTDTPVQKVNTIGIKTEVITENNSNPEIDMAKEKKTQTEYTLPIQKNPGKATTINKSNQSDTSVSIPSVGIEAPLPSKSSMFDPNEQINNMQKGPTIIDNGADINSKGNVVISGHSSRPAGVPAGSHDEVFKNLHKVNNGDIVTVNNNGAPQNYKVKNKIVVSPSDVEYMDKSAGISEGGRGLTIITCDPPGTSEKRLIVQAEPE
jgi:LPXTG-site transpeptidase (sortase) family protein